MADLSYPAGFFPFTDGSVMSGDNVFLAFFDDTNATESLYTVLNGGLDEDNFALNTVVGPEFTQRGSAVQAGGSSGTANLDFKYTWFSDYNPAGGVRFSYAATDPKQPIPGSCVAFYLRWPAQVLMTWQIYAINDNFGGSADGRRSHFFLLVDGAYQTSQERGVHSVGSALAAPKVYQTGRAWTGHALLDLAQGWHDVGICLVANTGFQHTRVWARSIDYVAFKDGGVS